MDRYEALEETIKSLEKEIEALKSVIKQLTEENAKLKSMLNMNSHNSSKPPSSDRFKKPPVNKDRNLRKSTGKKPGGQKGHEDYGPMLIWPVKNEDKYYEPSTCLNCPHQNECKTHQSVNTRYELDLVIEPKQITHKAVKRVCKLDGTKLIGSFPDSIQGSVQYGPSIKALVVTLYSRGVVSLGRIKELIDGLGMSMSTATIEAFINECAQRAKPIVREIAERLLRKPVINCD
jgi:transposase